MIPTPFASAVDIRRLKMEGTEQAGLSAFWPMKLYCRLFLTLFGVSSSRFICSYNAVNVKACCVGIWLQLSSFGSQNKKKVPTTASNNIFQYLGKLGITERKVLWYPWAQRGPRRYQHWWTSYCLCQSGSTIRLCSQVDNGQSLLRPILDNRWPLFERLAHKAVNESGLP